MKNFLMLMLVFFALHSWAQNDTGPNQLSYCGAELAVPEGCVAESEFSVRCDDYLIQWMYLELDMLSFAPQQYMAQLDDRFKRFKKKRAQGISMGQEIEAYKISYRENREDKYKIVAFGTVNGSPVLINVSLNNEGNSNEDLPDFVKQIIAFKE